MKIRPAGAFLLLGIMSIWLLHTDGDKLGGDGHDYFMYCRNLFFYGDLRFHSTDKDIVDERFQKNMKNGVLQTPFSIGPAVAWLPFYALAHGVTRIESLWKRKRITGFERNYREIIGWGTVVYVLIGLYLLYRLLLQFDIPNSIALLCVFSGYLGTFLINYTIFESSMAHGISFFAVALYLFLWHRFRLRLDYKKSVWVGLVAGFSVLMRYTNVIFLVVPLINLIRHFDWKKTRLLLTVVMSALLVFAVQMATWKICFGKYLTIPQGESFMIWGQPKILEVLFSCKHGLFAHHWLIPIGLIGFLCLAKAKRLDRIGFLVILVFLIYVNASTSDWYAGHSFGNRRFESLLPFVILGLSTPLMYIESLLSRKRKVILALLLSPFVFYNLAYLHYYRRNIDERDRVITPVRIMDHAYRKMGSLVHLPVNAYLSIRYRIPLGKADALLGNSIDQQPSGLIEPAVDATFFIDGWSDVACSIKGHSLRWIEGDVARIGFAVRNLRDGELQFRFSAVGAVVSFPVLIQLNGTTIASETIEIKKKLSVPIKRKILDPVLNILSIRIMKDPSRPSRIGVRDISFR